MRPIDADKLCEDLLTRWHTADENSEKMIQEVMADVVTPIVVMQPTVETKEVKYFDEDEKAWKIGEVIVNSSEKPNNCDTCKNKGFEGCEQPCLGCGCCDDYEPITQTETQNSNLTFEKRTMRDCYNCKRYETEGECIECNYKPKDEPQTCDTCRFDDRYGDESICSSCARYDSDSYQPKYEPQTERSE